MRRNHILRSLNFRKCQLFLGVVNSRVRKLEVGAPTCRRCSTLWGHSSPRVTTETYRLLMSDYLLGPGWLVVRHWPRLYGLHRACLGAPPGWDAYGASFALLVRFGPPDEHPEAFVGECQVLDVQRHQLAQAEPAGEAQQQEGLVPKERETGPGASGLGAFDRRPELSAGSNGAFCLGATPSCRARTPRRRAWRPGFFLGDGYRADVWARQMATKARSRVLKRRPSSARWVR